MTVQNTNNQKVASSQPAGREGSLTNIQRALIAVILALIILLGAFLRFYELGSSGVGNSYYAATVQSMLTSWHNFFYAAFEPGGSVTVDKPPLGFWIQAISAYLFGLNGFALALPQAFAGVLSIPLLYSLVRRHFGTGAGLIAALVLAVMPVTVSTERNNTIDGLLVFVLLLASWAFLEATRKGKLRYLLVGAILVGLGFNIKMLQATMPLPALYALYLFGAPHPWWKRVTHLAAATIPFLVVSLSWAIIVDLTPTDQRPYIGSSNDNSVIELITGHNGISRLIAIRRFGAQPSLNQSSATNGSIARQSPQGQPGLPGSDGFRPYPPGMPPGNPLPGGNQPASPPGSLPGISAMPPNQQGSGFRQEIGEPGLSRLFHQPLDIEASWLLPLALLGIPLILATIGWRWPLSDQHLGVILWGGWLLPSAIYFTFTSGLFHAYYLIMLGPPLAALVGGTFWALWKIMQRNHWLGWATTALLSGLTLIFQGIMLGRYPDLAPWFIAFSIGIWLIGIALTAFSRKTQPRLSIVAVSVLCISLVAAPLIWTGLTSLNDTPNPWLPRSGPAIVQTKKAPDSTQLSPTQQNLLDFLLAETDASEYLVATLNARQAAPYILATTRPVLTFGGFTGRDNIIEVEQLSQMVDDGDLRFILVDQSLNHEKPDIAAWIRQQCSVVQIPGLGNNAPTYPYFIGSVAMGTLNLFDCERSLP